MKPKLNAKSAFLVVLLYLVLSIIAGLFSAIFFGGIDSSPGDTNIDGVIDSGMYGTIVVSIVLVYISIYVFRDSTKDIFFERKSFGLSKLYVLFPLTWFGVALFALFSVDYASYSLGVILLVMVASLAIGVNEARFRW